MVVGRNILGRSVGNVGIQEMTGNGYVLGVVTKFPQSKNVVVMHDNGKWQYLTFVLHAMHGSVHVLSVILLRAHYSKNMHGYSTIILVVSCMNGTVWPVSLPFPPLCFCPFACLDFLAVLMAMSNVKNPV
jgi:hypothetical protein